MVFILKIQLFVDLKRFTLVLTTHIGIKGRMEKKDIPNK
jgi:hypothetical protein